MTVINCIKGPYGYSIVAAIIIIIIIILVITFM